MKDMEAFQSAFNRTCKYSELNEKLRRLFAGRSTHRRFTQLALSFYFSTFWSYTHKTGLRFAAGLVASTIIEAMIGIEWGWCGSHNIGKCPRIGIWFLVLVLSGFNIFLPQPMPVQTSSGHTGRRPLRIFYLYSRIQYNCACTLALLRSAESSP